MEDTMKRNPLASAAANYPYLQGLWTVPMGFLILFTGLSNLQERPAGPVLHSYNEVAHLESVGADRAPIPPGG